MNITTTFASHPEARPGTDQTRLPDRRELREKIPDFGVSSRGNRVFQLRFAVAGNIRRLSRLRISDLSSLAALRRLSYFRPRLTTLYGCSFALNIWFRYLPFDSAAMNSVCSSEETSKYR